MLLFKKKFLPAIRSGEKTQTIRLWNVCRMKSGQRSYIPGAGYIRVISVGPVELASLLDDDARPDGFGTADELRTELTSLYAGLLSGICGWIWLLDFKFVRRIRAVCVTTTTRFSEGRKADQG